MAFKGHLWESTLTPAGYAICLIAVCCGIIEWWNGHRKAASGGQRLALAVLAWGMTAAVVVYAHPCIETFADIWNNYLMP